MNSQESTRSTRFTCLLGCDAPVAAFTPSPKVVAAVSRAGGLGVLGAAMYSPEELELAVSWISEQVGERPYGVNVMFPSGSDESAEEIAHLIPAKNREFADSLMRRFAIPAPTPGAGPTPFGDAGVLTGDTARAKADIAIEHGSRLLVSALGPAPAAVVDKAKSRGILIGGMVGSAKHAMRHLDAGADLVVPQGTEAAGHAGETTTMVLVPEVADAARQASPQAVVLAAGGIGTGRQLAAALALGADGAWTGSIWLTATESGVDPIVVRKLLNAGSGDTVKNRSVTGKPMRQLRTVWTDALIDEDAPPPLPAPLQGLLLRDALVGIYQHQVADALGSAVGQIVGQMKTARSSGEILETLMIECNETIAALT